MRLSMNPYLPSWEYVPDGEPHVFDGRLYLFGSHDRFNGSFYCENDYVVWSAPLDDLSQWRCEGTSYRKKQDPQCRGFMGQLWAPDVCRGPDGHYYMYYCAAFSNWIGVAKADTPAGPYEYLGKLRYPDGTVYGKKKDDIPFDPGVFVDDDGKVWLYTGFASQDRKLQRMMRLFRGIKITGECSYVLELEPDMCTVRSCKACLPGPLTSKGTGFEGHAFYEASSMRKFGGKYYYIYSTEQSHELAWAVSDSPDRDFRFGGILYSNGNIGLHGKQTAEYPWGNNHGSIECVNGQYYVFGHRQTNYSECSRQGIAEKIEMDENGNFHQAEMTSCGLNGKPLPAVGKYPASIACVLHGIHPASKITEIKDKKTCPMVTQDLPDGAENARQYIGNIYDGSVIGYKYFEFDGDCQFSLTIKNSQAGTISVWQEEPLKGRVPLATLFVPQSSQWKICSVEIPFAKGRFPLYLQYSGEGNAELLEIGFRNEGLQERYYGF